MRKTHDLKKALLSTACVLCITVPTTAQSAVLGFHFTGNIMIAGPFGDPLNNYDSSGNLTPITPISATLNYDTATGLGGSNLSIEMSGGFWDSPATFHDISLRHMAGTNSIDGNILVDWNGNNNMQMHINWDATGFFNAINLGLDVGDTISGSILKQDTDNDGVFDTFTDVFSATPYSDSILASFGYTELEGAAPLAATNASLGLGYDIDGNEASTPFNGIRGLINIGSGNSLTVTSVSAVPVPAAVWLFGSGLIALAGLARRKNA